jgi:hypothetical protein
MRLPCACALLLAACGTVTPPPSTKSTPQVATASAPKAQPSTPAAAPSKATPPKAAPAAPPSKAQSPAPAAPPLDLKSLEQRLKDTSAIGIMTKLSLKNQVDDLVARFKAYHAGNRPPTLPELRPAFDLLLMKVLSLIQDHDQALARDLNASRDAIWGVLTDRQKLTQIQ